MLDRYPSQLPLESPFGNFYVPVAVASVVPALELLWITVKATQLDCALAAIKNGDGMALALAHDAAGEPEAIGEGRPGDVSAGGGPGSGS